VWGRWGEIRDPEEAWRALGRPRVAAALARISHVLFCVAMLPWLVERLREPSMGPMWLFFPYLGVFLILGVWHVARTWKLGDRWPTLDAVAFSGPIGMVCALELTERDFRAECICVHDSHFGFYVLAGTVGAIIGGGLGCLGIAAPLRAKAAAAARDIDLLPTALRDLFIWATIALFVAFLVGSPWIGVALVGVAASLLGAMLATRHRRRAFALAVAEGEIDGWTLTDDGFLVLTVDPPPSAAPYRSQPELVRVARVRFGLWRAPRDLQQIIVRSP
jgi:hypothetical protein